MSVDSIGRVATSEIALNQTAVGLEDFLEIFLAQLNFQDPLEPVDNREFIAQLAQFSALELANQTNEGVNGILEVEAVSQSVGMLGRTVNVSSANGVAFGNVVAIKLVGGQPVLSIELPTGQVLEGISPADVNVVRNTEG